MVKTGKTSIHILIFVKISQIFNLEYDRGIQLWELLVLQEHADLEYVRSQNKVQKQLSGYFKPHSGRRGTRSTEIQSHLWGQCQWEK